jgi:hypothetical protein
MSSSVENSGAKVGSGIGIIGGAFSGALTFTIDGGGLFCGGNRIDVCINAATNNATDKTSVYLVILIAPPLKASTKLGD